MPDNFPSIGEPVLDPSEKYQENGIDKYDLLLADGQAVNPEAHPELFELLGLSEYEEIGQLTASDAQAGDKFGSAASVYGDRLVVGSYLEDTTGTDTGKVYIYDWNGSIYVEIGQLTASDASQGDLFGVAVSVYGDRLVVGAYTEDSAGTDTGKVYIYDWNGSIYVEVGQLTASDAQVNDRFGRSVSVHEDRLIVGSLLEDTAATDAGKVYIYDWNGRVYVEIGQLTASDAAYQDGFGISASVYGDRLVVGAFFEDTSGTNAGKVYIYDWSGSQYVEVGQLTASDAQHNDYFGIAASVYGDRLSVGAILEDTATTDAGKTYIYDWNGSQYNEIGQLTASDAAYQDGFGISVPVYGDRLVVGTLSEDTAGTDAGKVYIYDESITANRPTMTSPDPLCPYRIVADLT